MPDKPEDEQTGFPTSSELSHGETFPPPPASESEPAYSRKGRSGKRLVVAALLVGLVSVILIIYFTTR